MVNAVEQLKKRPNPLDKLTPQPVSLPKSSLTNVTQPIGQSMGSQIPSIKPLPTPISSGNPVIDRFFEANVIPNTSNDVVNNALRQLYRQQTQIPNRIEQNERIAQENERIAGLNLTNEIQNIQEPAPALQNITSEQPQQPQDFNGVFPEGSTIGNIEQSVNKFGAQNLGAGSLVPLRNEILTTILKTSANIIDAVGSVWSGRKPADITAIEGALTDIEKTLAVDVEMVKNGDKSYFEAYDDIHTYEMTIGRLADKMKGLGQANIRFWNDDGGKGIEAQILASKRKLELLKTELEDARQEFKLNQAKRNLGVQ